MASAPVDVPVREVATMPSQPSLPVPPPAVQLVALLLLHANELALPACSDDGVAVKLEMLAGGASEAKILTDFPDLEAADIRACLQYAAAQVNHTVLQAA